MHLTFKIYLIDKLEILKNHYKIELREVHIFSTLLRINKR